MADCDLGREPVSPQGIAPVAFPEPNLTLVEGTTFCVSGHDGDIDPLRAATACLCTTPA